MEEYQAPPIGPEELCESVYRQVHIHTLGEHSLMCTNPQAYRIITSSNKRYRPTEICN